MLVKSRFALQMATSTSSISGERDITFEKCFSIAKIWRILYGRAEIRNLSSSGEKYFTSERSERVYYWNRKWKSREL